MPELTRKDTLEHKLADIPVPTEMSDETATKMGHKVYLGDGTTYYNGNAATITGGTNIVSQLIPYQMQDGSWRLKFNIRLAPSWTYVSGDHGSYANIYINGILFSDSLGFDFRNSVATSHNTYNDIAIIGSAMPNTNKIAAYIEGTGHSSKLYVSGDVTLDSKPTWAY